MIGIDLTRISRFENPTKELVKRILHPSEVQDYERAPQKAEFLAARWAIKEALFKADSSLGLFHRFAIEKLPTGVYTFPGYQISTSSEADFYIAVVIKGDHASTH